MIRALTRTERKKDAAAAPAAGMTATKRAELERLIADPDCGSMRRRHAQRQLAGIVTRGPTSFAPPPPPESPWRETSIEHQGAVEAEIAALDAHAAELDNRLAQLEHHATSFERQELQAERHQLRLLRSDLLGDLGRPLEMTAEQQKYVKHRGAEIRERAWSEAARAAAAGDHRFARQRRIAALRARQIVEDEIGLRQLPAYM